MKVTLNKGNKSMQRRPRSGRRTLTKGTILCVFTYLAYTLPSSAQNFSLANGTSFVSPKDLPPLLETSLQIMGGRMMSPDKAQVTLTGTMTDGNGSRAGQITVQAPGLLSYREGQTRALTFDGSQPKSKSGQFTADDEKVFESLLAHFPDAVFLQVATGGTWRRIGSHFRTDDGTTTNYTGPYWTLSAFSPKARQGLTSGKALQQSIFIALDEQTGLLGEVRIVLNQGANQQTVTQTQFSNWIQQGDQWFPGEIVRLENGNQVLSFQTQQASVGVSAAPAAFVP